MELTEIEAIVWERTDARFPLFALAELYTLPGEVATETFISSKRSIAFIK